MQRPLRTLVGSVGATLAVAAVIALPAAIPAGAQIQGDCTATVAGQDVETATSPASAIEVDYQDVVAVRGTDPSGAPFTRIELRFPPIPGIEVYNEQQDPNETTWGGDVNVADYATWGIGLYQVSGNTDDCTGTAWIKVTGKSPFTTVAGGIGTAVLAAGGIAAVTGLVRPNASPWAGLFRSLGAGAVAGVGAAVLAQQFGLTPLTGTTVAGWACALGSTVGLANVGVTTLRAGSAAAAVAG